MSGEERDPLLLLTPALSPNNVHLVAKVANRIPCSGGGGGGGGGTVLTSGMIFCAYSLKLFWKGKEKSSKKLTEVGVRNVTFKSSRAHVQKQENFGKKLAQTYYTCMIPINATTNCLPLLHIRMQRCRSIQAISQISQSREFSCVQDRHYCVPVFSYWLLKLLHVILRRRIGSSGTSCALNTWVSWNQWNYITLFWVLH